MKSIYIDIALIVLAIASYATLGPVLGIVTCTGLLLINVVRSWRRIEHAHRMNQVSVEVGHIELANLALEQFCHDDSRAAQVSDASNDSIDAKLLNIDEALAQVVSETAALELVLEDVAQAAVQTQLTSINSFFVAARASDDGKGFAVVAEEAMKIASRGLAICQTSAPIIQEIHQGAKRLSDQIAGHIQTQRSQSAHKLDQIETLAQQVAITLYSVEDKLKVAVQDDERIRGKLQNLNVTLYSTIHAAENLRTACHSKAIG